MGELPLEEEEETESNFLTRPASPTIANQWIGQNVFNEIRSDFSLDRFEKSSSGQDWDFDNDLNGEGESLSSDYVDFLLNYE